MLVSNENCYNLASQKNLLRTLLTKKRRFFVTKFRTEHLRFYQFCKQKLNLVFLSLEKTLHLGVFLNYICASCSQIEGKNENLKQ